MTAPDQPEPVCGRGSCTPDCGMGHCYLTDGTYIDPEDAHGASEHASEHAANQLPATPKSPADDLRQQLTDVLRRRLGSQLDLFPHAPEFLADGVMAVVQPVLDAKDTEIAELTDQLRRTRIELDHWRTVITAELRAERDQQRQRAEAAEAVANNIGAERGLLRLDLATAIKRAEDAERRLAELREEARDE